MGFPNGVSDQQVANCITPKRLELTILPTEKCNFRCTYCYEDFAIGRMKAHIVEGVKKLLQARGPELQLLQINWFGGEPLLALSVIEDVSKYGLELSQSHGFTFMGGLTTNGYLLSQATLQRLVELNQNFFQISLDGWGDVHNQTRRRADGRGTFDVIWKNLLDARDAKLQFEILLRVHVTNTNHDSLRELCRNIHTEFGGDNRFRVNFQDVRNLGGENGATIDGVAPKAFKQISQELGALAAGQAPPNEAPEPDSVYEAAAGESAGGRRAYQAAQNEPYICYASKPNHLMIRANGRIGKCTVALDDDRNDLGWINPDGTIAVDQIKVKRWYRGFESFDLEELGCPIATMHLDEVEERSERQIDLQVISQ